MISLRQAALESDLSRNLIHKILVKHNFHPFAEHMVQQLNGTGLVNLF